MGVCGFFSWLKHLSVHALEPSSLFKRNSNSWELFLGAPGAPARSGLLRPEPPFFSKKWSHKKKHNKHGKCHRKVSKMLPKILLCHYFLTRILKWENVFGLHRRERIEVQAILKTAKKRQKNDMQTNATHTFDLNGKVPNKLSKGSTFSRREAPYFQGFRRAPWVSKETTKLPKDGQGTPKGRPRVHKCLKKVWKWSQKLLKTKQYYWNGAAMTQSSVINAIVTQKHAKQQT